MTTIHSLPREVLMRVFSCYLETETQLSFICNVSHVCQDWREVCMDKSFWLKFDGTLPLCFLKKFFILGPLSKIEAFTFSNCQILPSRKELQDIYECLPCLKSINFSKVSWMLEKQHCMFFKELMRQCPNLSKIVLQGKTVEQKLRLDKILLQEILYVRGLKLTSLNISNTSVSGLRSLFRLISRWCPNLQELKARNMCNVITDFYFPLEYMQNGLKKLKVLRLGSSIMIKSETKYLASGFPLLETFTYPTIKKFSFNDSLFQKLLKTSTKLRLLDIRGRRSVTLKSFQSLTAENLVGLYVSDTKFNDYSQLLKIISKWGHSLVALDISRIKGNHVNLLFYHLIILRHLKNLEILYLNNTEVSKFTVKLIIQNCPKLNFLDLESCRAIGRGRQHKYRGQRQIRELLNLDIDESMDTS